MLGLITLLSRCKQENASPPKFAAPQSSFTRIGNEMCRIGTPTRPATEEDSISLACASYRSPTPFRASSVRLYSVLYSLYDSLLEAAKESWVSVMLQSNSARCHVAEGHYSASHLACPEEQIHSVA